MRTIIFISNPFGYGPTGSMLSLLAEFKKVWNERIVVAGNRFIGEIVDKQSIVFEEIDVRDIEEIKKLLNKYSSPYIFSSQNRFSIVAAIDKKIPCAFLDTLTWMWTEIPEEYLKADIYFGINLPGKVIKNIHHSNYYSVPFILQQDHVNPLIESGVLINVGGGENPLFTLNTSYYAMLAKAINSVEWNDVVHVVGGTKTLNSMKTMIKSPKIKLSNYDHKQFLSILSNAKHLITTSGLNTTLEAFAYNIPTSFIPPTNLSQQRLLEYLIDSGVSKNAILWSDFFPNKIFNNDMTEKEGLIAIERMSKILLSDHDRMPSFINKFSHLVEIIPDIVSQKIFVDNTGIDGAKKIITILREKWRF